jgi:hypothetical protein
MFRGMVFWRQHALPRRVARGGLWSLAAALAVMAPGARAGDGDAALDFEGRLKPFIANYCASCHGMDRQRAEINLERFDKDPEFSAHRELWEKVAASLESHEMPPENRKQPSLAERQEIVQGIRAELARIDAAAPPNPGAVTIRRLNRNEYRNTIRDLLGVDYDTHANFPHDESGYGFDNIGDVLSLPPLLLEKYLAAAEEIAAKVIMTEDPATKRVKRIGAKRFKSGADADSISLVDERFWGFYREGEISTEHNFAESGAYRLRITAYGEQAGPELPKMGVRVDGREIHVQEVRAIEGKPETFEVEVELEAGAHKLAVAYLNNFNTDGDRNLFMRAFEVVGPLGAAMDEYPEVHRRVLPRRPEKGKELAYAAEALRPLMTRAFRRPVKDAEVERLVGLVKLAMEDQLSFEEGMRLALQAVLVSPHFLYRWELDPKGWEAGQIRELGPYEVASRLSYFLWSSMPDDELFALAESGELLKSDVLEAQARRMLADPRAEALVKHFGIQWLQIQSLDQLAPDKTVFPTWDASLREAMKREAELFFWEVVREDRSIMDLLNADYTYLNERLAKHYGIEGVEGDEFRRVKLPPETGRGGVLTMGSVLTVTSFPTRTAPVLRGKWILEQILGTPPPPPPPNVPPIEETEQAGKAATLRQRLELHRSNPDCISCHQKMDPLGFALENFDAIGGWRTSDGELPIDTSAELPNGRKVEGAQGLKEVLLENEAFPNALATKMLTYALGRGVEAYDRPALREILERLSKNDFKFSSLVLGIATSDPFLKRQPQFATHEKPEQHAVLSR